MRSPDQIDDLILDDIHAQDSIILRLEREMAFHQKKRTELTGMMGCEHEPEKDGASHDHCRLCGYRWVR